MKTKFNPVTLLLYGIALLLVAYAVLLLTVDGHSVRNKLMATAVSEAAMIAYMVGHWLRPDVLKITLPRFLVYAIFFLAACIYGLLLRQTI